MSRTGLKVKLIFMFNKHENEVRGMAYEDVSTVRSESWGREMKVRKIKKWPRIVKFNGDIKLGGVTVADGVADDYWMESVESILDALLRWKKGNGWEFVARTRVEGPDFLLVEWFGNLAVVEMGSSQSSTYENVMPMETFARKFVREIEHFLSDEGKRKRWRRPWLPKKGKLEVKKMLKMVDEYRGKIVRVKRARRGAARAVSRKESK